MCCAEFSIFGTLTRTVLHLYVHPGGTLLQKYFKIRSWVPSPQMPYFGGRPHHPSDLKNYRRGLVSSELLSETEIFFLLETKGQQPASSSERRAVKEDELHAELEQQGQRDEAVPTQPPAAAGSWRTSGARSSSSGSLTWRCTWHSAS